MRRDTEWTERKENVGEKMFKDEGSRGEEKEEEVSPLIILRRSDSVAAGNTSLKHTTHIRTKRITSVTLPSRTNVLFILTAVGFSK